MFGTSGIRGIYGKEITPELALRIANAFSSSDIAIARDTRETGPVLEKAAIAGALCAGRDAVSLGMAPTPILAYATVKHNANGIMVTASHNPPEYNGLKLVSDGLEITKAQEGRVLENYAKGPSLSSWDETGTCGSDDSIVQDYMEFILPMIDAESIRRRAPKVVVDCNGAAAVATPELLESLGCSVTAINMQKKGFARPSEPSGKNLSALCEKVRETGADLGLAHDGDGDRIALVDEAGNFVNMDVQLSLMIMHELEKRKGKVVSTVESSLIIRDAVSGAGGELAITPVGSTYVGESLRENSAVFGGEPAGEYIYSGGVHVPDGILGAAKFAEIFAQKGKISALAASFSPSPMVREKYETKDKRKAMEKILSGMDIEGKVSTIDGVRVDSDDYWALMRPSGTEPVIRLTLEAKSRDVLERVHMRARKLILESV